MHVSEPRAVATGSYQAPGINQDSFRSVCKSPPGSGRYRSRFCNLLLSTISLVVLISAVYAQPKRESTTRIIPSPRSVLGFNPGDDRTIADWKQITDYFARLDKASDRVAVQTIGTSTLGPTMIAAFISAPENIRSLEKYKAIQARLADPRRIASDVERDQLVRDGKTVVVISCSIHSTEIVASQMEMQLAYNLASANDPDTLSMLRNTILILIPSPNPDGVDIVANWYRKTLGTSSEGREPPELYHHYAGHDDNRDWFMLGLIGHKMAADVTAAGFKGILTNALYDTWWHGGFRTAPYFHNSIGILTKASSARIMTPSSVTREQLGRSGTRGMRSAMEATTNFPDPWPGGTWHPHDIMQMELIACHSVLSLAANYRADYLRNFFELGKANLSGAFAAAAPIAYLIPAGQGRDENVAKMIGTLVEQGVEVYRLDREVHAVSGDQSMRPTAASNRTIVVSSDRKEKEVPAGSYIIFLNQPYRKNVLALFEPQIYPDRTTATV